MGYARSLLRNQISFNDAGSWAIRSLTRFHDTAICAVVLISVYVFRLTYFIKTNKVYHPLKRELHEVEAAWTVAPALILLALALPSLKLLYLLDEVKNPILSLKTIGHQWYWRYDYANLPTLRFDSYIIPTPNLELGERRLLEVDNRVVLPGGVETRVLVSSADVIHSWTIPRLGVKVDAVPGRLNQIRLFPSIPGVWYGQCSEICGANHAFIPICLETVRVEDWARWAYNKR